MEEKYHSILAELKSDRCHIVSVPFMQHKIWDVIPKDIDIILLNSEQSFSFKALQKIVEGHIIFVHGDDQLANAHPISMIYKEIGFENLFYREVTDFIEIALKLENEDDKKIFIERFYHHMKKYHTEKMHVKRIKIFHEKWGKYVG